MFDLLCSILHCLGCNVALREFAVVDISAEEREEVTRIYSKVPSIETSLSISATLPNMNGCI